MSSSRRIRSAAAVAACGVVGAVAGIAGSAAAPSHKAGNVHTEPKGPMIGMLKGPPVHADAVVLNKAGTAFITATEDNGRLKSVSGSNLTITEAAKSVTYKDQAITLPASATIERNGASAKLSDLKPGDMVHVSQSSDGVRVFAADASFRPMRVGVHMGGHDGPPPGLGGPPPLPAG